MIIPVPHLPDKNRMIDPADVPAPPVALHHKDLSYREGEFVICRDSTDGQDWYVAEITKVLDRHIQVSYFHTPSPPLEKYPSQSLEK